MGREERQTRGNDELDKKREWGRVEVGRPNGVRDWGIHRKKPWNWACFEFNRLHLQML